MPLCLAQAIGLKVGPCWTTEAPRRAGGRRLRARVRVIAPALASARIANAPAARPGVSPAGAWLQAGVTPSRAEGLAERGRGFQLRAKQAASGEGYESGSGSDSEGDEPKFHFGLTPAELLQQYGCAPRNTS